MKFFTRIGVLYAMSTALVIGVIAFYHIKCRQQSKNPLVFLLANDSNWKGQLAVIDNIQMRGSVIAPTNETLAPSGGEFVHYLKEKENIEIFLQNIAFESSLKNDYSLMLSRYVMEIDLRLFAEEVEIANFKLAFADPPGDDYVVYASESVYLKRNGRELKELLTKLAGIKF